MAREEVSDSKCKQKIVEQNVQCALLFVGKTQTCKNTHICIYTSDRGYNLVMGLRVVFFSFLFVFSTMILHNFSKREKTYSQIEKFGGFHCGIPGTDAT